MTAAKTVLITGAAGNLGGKLRQHLHGRYPLRLLDVDPRGDAEIIPADLSRWDAAWVRHFSAVETVIHLAGDPTAHQTWSNLLGPNVEAVAHVFQAAVQAGVRRVVYASSNHVMGGYQHDPAATRLTTDVAPRPGTLYRSAEQDRDSTPYAAAKLFGERLGKCYAQMHGLSVIAVRLGWVWRGDNTWAGLPADRGPWFRMMWLSDRDFCHLMERCIEAELPERFVVVNGMSANTGMRWDIEDTRQLLGYQPQDDVTRPG